MRRCQPGAIAAAAFAVVALLALAPPAGAGLSKYEDPHYGFRFKFPDRDWSQTPTQPGETTEVAKFKDDRKGTFNTVSIYRFAASTGDDDVVTPREGESPTPAQPRGYAPGSAPPEDAAGYLLMLLARTATQFGQKLGQLPEAKTVKFGRIEGRLYQVELVHPRAGWRFGYLAGIVSNGEEEYLILFTRRNKLKKVLARWTRSIRSFRFRDDDTEVTEEPDEEEIEERDRTKRQVEDLLDPEKRERVKKDLVGEWRFIDTQHYIIIYNCDDRLARHIAKRVEYMRTCAFEAVFPPVAPIEEAMVVRVCKEMDEYHHYGGPGGTAGYWASGRDELVFPDLSRSKKPDEGTIGVLNHEAFHQYIHYALLKNNLPIWFNEGFAEYFFCVESTGEKLKFMKRHPMRYGTVKSALGAGKLIPVKDFIKMNQGQYYARANLCYAQGWAFCTWMKNVSKDERYRRIPQVMFQEMQKGYAERAGGGAPGQRFVPGMFREYNPVVQAAMQKAFEGIDLDQMDEDFKKDLKRKM